MKKVITDPAILLANKTRDKNFEASGGWSFDRDSTVKQFGRNRVLKGQPKFKKK
jgi:hypothetical protein